MTQILDNMLRNVFSEDMPNDLHHHSITISDAGPSNNILWVNAQFEKHTGYNRDEVIGKNMLFLQGPETAKEAIQLFQYFIKNSLPGKIMILNYRKDGSKFWHICQFRPIFNAAGETTHFLTIQRPIYDA